MEYANNALSFLVNILQWLVSLVFLLRIILQYMAVNMINPIAQAIFKFSQPVVGPLQSIFPNFKRFNTAALVILILAQLIPLFIQIKLVGAPIIIIELLFLSVISLFKFVLDFYFWTIILSAVLSWLPNAAYNPLAQIINAITAPILKPISARLPLIGGIDFSPVVALIVIKLIEILVLGPLYG